MRKGEMGGLVTINGNNPANDRPKGKATLQQWGSLDGNTAQLPMIAPEAIKAPGGPEWGWLASTQSG